MNLYQTITDKIIAELEKGSAPWIKSRRADLSADKNLVSDKPYRGINRMLLCMSAMSNGYQSNVWATYRQWREQGAKVKKGETGTQIVLFKPISGTENKEAGEREAGFCAIRGYTVFNATQTNLHARVFNPQESDFNPIPACEKFLSSTGANITHGGDAAFYLPSQDAIKLPNKSAFNSPSHYYATAFHELTHWTGHKSRCDRQLGNKFGNPDYAFEELIAEIGAAYLCADHQLQGELCHAGHIQSWIKALLNSDKAIFKAASLAQNATDYLHGLQGEMKITAQRLPAQ